MILLPSDPLYEQVMADQAEENQSNVLAEAFRSGIYLPFSKDDSWNIDLWNRDWDNNYIKETNNYLYDLLISNPERTYTQPQNYLLGNVNYPDSMRSIQGLPYNDAHGWGSGNGTWVDPHEPIT